MPISYAIILAPDLAITSEIDRVRQESADYRVSEELDTSKVASSAIPSESQSSMVRRKSAEHTGLSKSLKVKSNNVSKIQNFNELITNKKLPKIVLNQEQRTYLTNLGRLESPVQIQGKFVIVNQHMWNCFIKWHYAEDEVRLNLVHPLQSTIQSLESPYELKRSQGLIN
jgi:hypothetical protein